MAQSPKMMRSLLQRERSLPFTRPPSGIPYQKPSPDKIPSSSRKLSRYQIFPVFLTYSFSRQVRLKETNGNQLKSLHIFMERNFFFL